MRRSLPAIAACAAVVGSLLVAPPASATPGGRDLGPVVVTPTEADGATVAPVSEDAHPVEPEVEVVSFDSHSDVADAEIDDAPADASTSEGTVTGDDATDHAVTDEPAVDGAEESPAADEPTSDAATETPSGEDAATEDASAEDATAEDATTEAAQETVTQESPEEGGSTEASPGDDAAAVEEEHTEEGYTEDGDHTHDEDVSGQTLASQVYASSTTADLVIVGVSWDRGTAPDDLVVEARTRTGETWTEWEPLVVELDETRDDAAAADARDGTSALAVIDADEVEVRLASDDRLPLGASLAVVDPGESTADTNLPAPTSTATAGAGGTGTSVAGGTAGRGVSAATGALAGLAALDTSTGTPTDVTSTDATLTSTTATARPTIYSRAQWGADESMMTWTPSQGRVQGIDIHHTVNANDYSSAQVPALLRGIYAYHAQDWGRGWGDIGYNFIVDRFGRIWEGRYGGVDAAPVGAHATGLNSNFSGISLLGNFDITPVPSAMFLSVARLAAWKLALHGVTTAYGTVTVDAGTFNRINGHRDSKQTTCPGKYMYNRLAEMRDRISGYLGSFAGRALDRDMDGDGYADLIMRNGTSVSLVSTVDRGLLSFVDRGTGWSPTKTTSAGDVNGDGNPDVYMIRPDGRMYLYLSTSSGALSSSPRVVASGWQSVTAVAGGVDWDGDGRADVVTRRADGTLWLNRGSSGGALHAGTRISAGNWRYMSSIALVPDFSSGRPALLARSSTSGTLYAYAATESGGLGSSRALGTGVWEQARFIAGTPDVTGPDGGDVLMLETDGELWLIPGTGTGSLTASARVFLGRIPTDARLVLPYQRSDEIIGFHVVRANSVHTMRRYAFRTAYGAYTDAKPTGITVSTSDRAVVAAGDWDQDGRADIMVVKADGRLMLHRGMGSGRFYSTGIQVASGWDAFSAVIGVPNLRGDGNAGLVAWHRSSGQLWYYPSDGDDGYRTRVLVSNGASGMDLLVNAGLWNGGGATDFLMRGAESKRLFLYDGNGPGLAFPPDDFSGGWQWMESIVGVGDVTRDGKPDLVMLSGSGLLRVYAGTGRGGLSLWGDVAQWPSAATLS